MGRRLSLQPFGLRISADCDMIHLMFPLEGEPDS